MTPKNKADELVKKFESYSNWGKMEDEDVQRDNAKSCAIILCDEMIWQLENLHKPEYTSFFFGEMGSGTTVDGYELKEYWQQVKKEIENL